MIANAARGEIIVRLDGKEWLLCLTLGALAWLEERLEAKTIMALSEKFSAGKLSASDLIAVITAGLSGGGHTLSEQEVGEMRVEGSVAGYVEIVSNLFAVTFTPLNHE